ncbi:MAG: tetratricopeptide repeat protein [Rhodospirillaceae bacterium]|jgi:tetratricopeptide (TPR) repeat protein|nr:tetratricopeptide repeat protein [Rhodospirillaceae bacterium]MBT7265939.1 tetratricopeptide repeat protein [Rhodospirillaceae bacterium]
MKYIGTMVLMVTILLLSAPVTAGQDDPRLNQLFASLLKFDNGLAAKPVEDKIWKIWLENKNSPVQLILHQGIQAMNTGRLQHALRAFNEVVEMEPNFAGGWNKRATVYYLMQDFPASVKDIAQTLRLEPRHFGALSGLGLINAALGRHQAALKAFEQAITIHPQMRGARQHIKILKELLKGEET